jgi:hypothetical protein
VVEVTLKPVDFFARVDNRGTPARGPPISSAKRSR